MINKVLAGNVLSYGFNHLIGNWPSRQIRMSYLKAYLAEVGAGTSVQMGCRFLNGRKVPLGDRNVINFGCLFDGRHYQIRTGCDVSIGPEASILTLGHDPQSSDTEIEPDTTLSFKTPTSIASLNLKILAEMF